MAVVLGTALYLFPMSLSAQEAAGFTVLRHGDTVAVEHYAREPYSLARQTSRVIFKEDSVAIDVVTRSSGMRTMIFPTAVAAAPYLNLSMAFLEQATRRAAAAQGDSLGVDFFNLGGGQTAPGTVRRVAPDSAVVRIGIVEFRLRVDAKGRILGGALPAQDLIITRDASP